METALRRFPAQARLLILALLAATAQAQNCPEANPAEQKAKEAECRAQGGEWARFGVRDHLCNVYSCAPRTKDGGKPCQSSADCEHQCVSEKGGALGSDAAGQCTAVVTSFGCRYQVEGGRIVGRICVD